MQGANGETWCAANHPEATTVRMGLSPGGADIYTAQLERQWVDITGLDPGRVVVRGEANPLHCVLESNSANNDTQVTREIPGVRVADVSGGSSVSLAGVVVAPQVPARRSGGCVPGADVEVVLRLGVGGRAAAVLGHARASRTEPSRSHRVPTACTPRRPTRRPRGSPAPDSFTYVATDLRGLTSKPATAHVMATTPSPAAVSPMPRLSKVRVVRRHGRWQLRFRSSGSGRISGGLERKRGKWRVVRRLRARILDPGPDRIGLGPVQRARYRLVLRVNGRVAARVRFRERF